MSVQRGPEASSRAHAVAERLSAVLEGPVANLAQLSGGASRETWTLELQAQGGARPLVLQLDRLRAEEAPGRRPRPAQAPLLRAAAEAGVPVAPVLAWGKDDRVLGSQWLVLERVAGTTDPRVILAADGVPGPDALLDQLAAALSAVHRMPADERLAPLVADPMAELRAMHDELGQPHPVFELAFRELGADRPPSERRTLVHGDFRMGNLLVGSEGLSAVLDWELTHLGDPLEDLGWVCVRAWRFGRPDRPAAGLGSRETLAAAYERHSGVAIRPGDLAWWELFGTLRWGVICVVQAFTHLSGAARSLEHAVIGRRACEVEWDLLEMLDPSGAQPSADAGPERFAAPRGRESSESGPAPPRAPLHDRPTPVELLDAVRSALGDHVLPGVEGRPAFEVRVARRAVGMVERELRLAPEHATLQAEALRSLGVADQATLADQVRAGAFDERRAELCAALRAIGRAKLQVANPRYPPSPAVSPPAGPERAS